MGEELLCPVEACNTWEEEADRGRMGNSVGSRDRERE